MPQLLELSHHVTILAFHYRNIIFNPLDLWGTKLAQYIPSHPSFSKAPWQMKKTQNAGVDLGGKGLTKIAGILTSFCSLFLKCWML